MKRIAIIVSSAIALCLAQTPMETPPIGQAAAHSIAGGQVHQYFIEQQPGEFIEAVVFQRSIDVQVRLHGPKGNLILESSSPSGPFGPETIAWAAEESGTWRIAVTPVNAKARSGSYEIQLTIRRRADAHDLLRASAEKLLSDAAAALRKSPRAPDLRNQFVRAAGIFKAVGADARAAAAFVALSGHQPQISANEAMQVRLNDLETAIALSRKARDIYGEARAQSKAMYLIYPDAAKAEMALRFGEAAIEGLGRAGDLEAQAQIMTVVQRILDSNLSRFDDAAEMARLRIDVYRQRKDRTMEARTRSELGDLYKRIGEYAKSMEQYRASVSIFRDVKDFRGEADQLWALSNVYLEMGLVEQDIANLEHLLALCLGSDNRSGEVQTLGGLARIHWMLGHRELANSFANRAERMIEETTKNNRGPAYLDLGEVFRTLRQYSKAVDFFEKAVGVFHEGRGASNINYEGRALLHLSSALGAAGRRPEAIAANEKARDLFRQIRQQANEGNALLNLGILHMKSREFERAMTYLEQVLAMARAARFVPREADVLSVLMDCASGQKQDRLAVFYGKQAVNAYQSMRGNIRSLEGSDRKSYLEKHQATYRKLADLLIRQGRISEAEQILNLLKENEYFEFVRRASGSEPKRADLTPEEQEWDKQSRQLGDQLVSLGARRSQMLAKMSLTPQEERELNVLDNDLAAGNLAYRQYMKDLNLHFTSRAEPGRGRVAQIREAEGLKSDLAELGNGAVVLYTLAGEEKYYVILITSEVQKAYEYPIAAADLARKVLAFRDATQTLRRDPRPLAQELQKILIGPELARDLRQAGAQTLMWSLDGVLRYLPLAALHDGSQYLIEQYRLAIFTPASHSRLKDKPKAQWSGLGFGVTKPHEDFTALPGVNGELEGIIRQSAGERGVMGGRRLIDEHFTRQSLREALRRQPAVVHIASHFRFQPGDERQSFLLLGDGSRLTLAELKTFPDLFRGVDLLTLSACNTGVGDATADGKEVESFSVLAQLHGAKAVLATLWPVGDESTSDLMREFYRLHESQPGMLKAEALRQAQLALLRGTVPLNGAVTATRGGEIRSLPRFGKTGEAPFAHPYYWAPFFLTGNWQ